MRIPSYRLHKPSGRAVVTLAGKQYYLGVHNSDESKRNYQRLIAEYLASPASFGVAAKDITIIEVLAAYSLFATKYYGVSRGSEWYRLKSDLGFLKDLYAELPVSEFGPSQFKAVRESILRQVNPVSKRMRSRRHVNQMMKRIARMFKWAAGEAMIPASIYESIRLVPSLKRGRTEAPESKPVLSVAQSDIDKTLLHLPETVADMVSVQLLCGCRPGELCRLKIGMIDRSDETWAAILQEHKTAHHGHTRCIYFGAKAQEILKKYLDRGTDAYVFSPRESEKRRRNTQAKNRTTPLNQGNRPGYRQGRLVSQISARVNDCYSRMSYAKCIKRAAEAANVPHWAPNQLRHTAATMYRSKFGLEVASAILGHSEVATTQIYAEADRSKAMHAVSEIG